MKKTLLRILGALAVGLLLSGCARLAGIPETGDPLSSQVVAPFEFVEGKAKVLIGFRSLPGPADEALVRAHGGEVRFTYRIVSAIAASVPEPAIEGLRRNPRVTAIEPDVTIYLHDIASELNNTWGVKRIGAGDVHATGNLGSQIKVGILDTGIDYTHPELSAVYAGGYDFVNKDSDPKDDHGHGTHVAGTVAAARNGTGVVGVAPQAYLYGLKVLGANGSGSFSNVIAALDWCVTNGIRITNHSYGSQSDPGATVRAAFDNAYTAGILHVASAGNRGEGTDTVGFPAKYGSVIAVAATTSADLRASYSSTGPDVELAAPGSSINSTKLGGGYVVYSGTSMASPHVAGTAALVWYASPTWTNAQIRQRLVETADDLGTAGRDPWYGYGLVDADEAAAVVAPPTPGTIVVKKTVVGVAPASAWAFSGTSPIGAFTLPAGGGTATFADLTPSVYTVTETAKSGYTVTYKVDGGAAQSGSSATVTLAAGQTITIEFTNTAAAATITVTKTVVGATPGSAWEFTGTAPIGTFTRPAAGGTGSFTVPAGTYTVTETTKTGYTATYKVNGGAAQAGNSATVTPTPGQTIVIEFINTAQPGAITVTKTVVGTAPADPWQFTGTNPIGTFTLPAAGGTSSAFSVPAGQSYAITETTKPNYTVTWSYRVDGGAPVTGSGSSVTVTPGPGQAVAIEFTNTYAPPAAMYVAAIDMALGGNKNFTSARATVTVRDASGNPVSGATVTATWSGATSGSVSGTTDAAGKVTFTSAQVRTPRSGTTFTLCVTNIAKAGWVYEPSRNAETCDSVRVP